MTEVICTSKSGGYSLTIKNILVKTLKWHEYEYEQKKRKRKTC